jgi:hypothetical protein
MASTPGENWPRVAIFAVGVLALVALLASLPEKAHAQVGGAPTASKSSTAVSASLVAFTGYSTLYNVVMYNSSGSTLYLQVFDTNAVPANGTAPTLAPVQVPAHATASITCDAGRRFTNGIVIGCSTTDTTFTGSTSGWMDCVFGPQ